MLGEVQGGGKNGSKDGSEDGVGPVKEGGGGRGESYDGMRKLGRAYAARANQKGWLW